jgi:hypothetical protein
MQISHNQIERVARYKPVISADKLFPDGSTRLHEPRGRRKFGYRTVLVPGKKRVHLAVNTDGNQCKRGPQKDESSGLSNAKPSKTSVDTM